jgi:hypothetical protein
MIQVQHTPETSETIETYNCNIGERETDVGSTMATGSTGIRGFGAGAGPRPCTGAAARVTLVPAPELSPGLVDRRRGRGSPGVAA